MCEWLPTPHVVEIVSSDDVALELGRDGQVGSSRGLGPHQIGNKSLRRHLIRAVCHALGPAIILGQPCIQERKTRAQREVIGRSPFDFVLDAFDARIAAVLNDRDAIDPQKGKLEILPIFPKHCTVPTQAVVEPLRFPANLIVLEKVGLVGADVRLRGAVDAAGTKALGEGGINQFIGIDLVREIHSRHGAAAGHSFIEVCAGGERGRGRSEAQLLTRSEGVIQRVSVEALQGIVKVIVAQAAVQRPLRCDVPGHLRKGRLIAVDARLVREPNGVRKGRDRLVLVEAVRVRRRRIERTVGIGETETRHDVLLPNTVLLTLDEHADRAVNGELRRRREAQLMAPFLEVALIDHDLLPHDGLAGVIDPVRSRPVCTIIEFGVVAVVGNRMRVAFHERARVREIEIAELAFDGQRRLNKRVIGSLRAEMH